MSKKEYTAEIHFVGGETLILNNVENLYNSTNKEELSNSMSTVFFKSVECINCYHFKDSSFMIQAKNVAYIEIKEKK